MDLEDAEDAARRFFRVDATPVRLGWGVSGYVFLSPDLRTAVKIHRANEGFERELEAYRRLRRHKVRELLGLSVPQMRGHRMRPRLIQMDVVRSPYLLDFAGVNFSPPDFSADVMEHWHGQLEEVFGPNIGIIYAVQSALERYGIYYMDFRPSNIRLEGHPDFLSDNDERP